MWKVVLLVCIPLARGSEVLEARVPEPDFDAWALKVIKKSLYPDIIDDEELHSNVFFDLKENLGTSSLHGCAYFEDNLVDNNFARICLKKDLALKYAANYRECRIVVQEARWDRSNAQGCHNADGCKFSMHSMIETEEKSTSKWKVGAKAVLNFFTKLLKFTVSAEYGASSESKVVHENSISTTVKVKNGEEAIPLVLVGGLECKVEMRIFFDNNWPLGSPESSEAVKSACEDYVKGRTILPCTIFCMFEELRSCVYSKYTNRTYPSSVPVYNCNAKDKVSWLARTNKTVSMPLYDKNGQIVKIKYIYVIDPLRLTRYDID